MERVGHRVWCSKDFKEWGARNEWYKFGDMTKYKFMEMMGELCRSQSGNFLIFFGKKKGKSMGRWEGNVVLENNTCMHECEESKECYIFSMEIGE